MGDSLQERAQHWVDHDPDPETRNEISELINNGQWPALSQYFAEELTFGTAGLRAALGPGPARMNRLVVRRATNAVAIHMLESHPTVETRSVVVGFDGRHGSRIFAHDAARVFAAHDFLVYLYEDTAPTPQIAHAVRDLNTLGGVMVTASHNPPGDNGYKVFWSDGAQIVPPHDRLIAAHIDKLVDLSTLLLPAMDDLVARAQVISPPSEVADRYVEAILNQRVCSGVSDLSVVYSAMHGVGWPMVNRSLTAAGYEFIVPVVEQRDPDPNFTTVHFPNPEEPGAMDLSLALAKERGADLVVANDPDADRLAVAAPKSDGEYRMLTGNQVGCLLAHYLLENGHFSKPLVVTTIVSTKMLSYIAKTFDVAYKETLTGFKWLAHEAIKIEAEGGHFVLGFEEALGYSVGPVVRDKDGVSAILQFCDLATHLKKSNRTVWDQLEALYRTHGYFYSRQHSIKRPGSDGRIQIQSMMETIRGASPKTLGGVDIARVRDFATGVETDIFTGASRTIELPKSNVLAFELSDGGSVLVRPSGTEPKIKFYFEVRHLMGANDTLELCEEKSMRRVDELQEEILFHCGVNP